MHNVKKIKNKTRDIQLKQKQKKFKLKKKEEKLIKQCQTESNIKNPSMMS